MIWIFLGFALLGLAGLSPSVDFGDSGEFIAAAATLSIPHAPGYPLYCLLGKAMGVLVPWANWGYRVNLLSTFSAAAALAVLWDAAVRYGLSRVATLAGVLFLGLSPLWLHTSLQAEVFALNNLLGACALWVVCRYRERALAPRPMAALGLCLGLGGGNHHMLVFAAPPLLLEAWVRSRWDPRRLARGLLWLLAFGLLGLAVYLLLPIRARAFPPLDWGHPVSWKAFVHVLLRKDYGSFSLTVDGAQTGRLLSSGAQAARYGKALLEGFGPSGAALCLLGLFADLRAGRWLPFLWMLFAGLGFLWLGNPPFDPQTSGALGRFYLLSWLGAAFALARGVEVIERRWRPAALALLAVAPAAAALRAPSWSLRGDLAAHDYGRNLLRSLPPSSALYIDGGDDTFYTMAYLQYAERLRGDVEVHDRGGLVFRNPYGPDFRSLTKERKEERRLLVEGEQARSRPVYYSTLRDRILPEGDLSHWGLLRGAGKPPAAGDPLWELYPRRFSPALARAHYRYRALVPVYDVLRAGSDLERGDEAAALARLRRAAAEGPDVRWLRESVSRRAQWLAYGVSRRGDWAASENAYRLALELEPDADDVWGNLGVALEKQGRLEEAETVHRRSLALAKDPFLAYHNLGSLYWSMGRWKDSQEMFDAALRARPGDAGARAFAEKAARRGGLR